MAMGNESNLKMIQLEPVRPAMETPHADAKVNSFLSEAYDTGRWNSIIDICGDPIARFVGSFPHPIFDSSDVIKLYLSSQAYRAMDQKDKYIACLKILYSLTPFSNALGGRYRDMLETGAKEYISLSKDLGVDYLNDFQVKGLFKFKETSGCFIATACYDSYYSPEVMVLRSFRDRVLLNSLPGKVFVTIYYFISPPIANFISKREILKTVVRRFLIGPLIYVLRNQDRRK
jgi:hypothetical protein